MQARDKREHQLAHPNKERCRTQAPLSMALLKKMLVQRKPAVLVSTANIVRCPLPALAAQLQRALPAIRPMRAIHARIGVFLEDLAASEPHDGSSRKSPRC